MIIFKYMIIIHVTFLYMLFFLNDMIILKYMIIIHVIFFKYMIIFLKLSEDQSYSFISGANICNQRDTTSPTGDVTSPNYPTNYPVSQTCSFTITVSTGQSIVISFKAMDLEQDEGIIK